MRIEPLNFLFDQGKNWLQQHTNQAAQVAAQDTTKAVANIVEKAQSNGATINLTINQIINSGNVYNSYPSGTSGPQGTACISMGVSRMEDPICGLFLFGLAITVVSYTTYADSLKFFQNCSEDKSLSCYDPEVIKFQSLFDQKLQKLIGE